MQAQLVSKNNRIHRILLASVLLGALGACREGTQAVSFLPIALPMAGTDGCNSPNNTFVAPALAYMDSATIGPMSQITASQTEESLFLTGEDGTILELDFSANPTSPTVTTIIGVGEVDTLLDTVFSPGPVSVMSGIALLDDTNLVVVEHTSNTILIVSRTSPMSVGFFIGFPDQTPSLVDGAASAARFGFGATPVQVVATGDGRLFVADGGNHVIREVQIGSFNSVRQVAGLGVPVSLNGSIGGVGFDSPSGLAIDCAGELIITEGGTTGNQVRVMRLGPNSFFGGVTGTVATLAGDGMNLSVEGNGATASLANPVSPVTTANGEIYWVDADTGKMRRYNLATGLADCPITGDCTTAASFSGMGNYSVAVTMSGRLYVLDGGAETIYLVTP